MRWVNDTLPPRPRPRWLLITIRLSTRSLAGIARTLVAVGTARLAVIFAAVRAAAPRSRTRWSSSARAAPGADPAVPAAPAAADVPGVPGVPGVRAAGWPGAAAGRLAAGPAGVAVVAATP